MYIVQLVDTKVCCLLISISVEIVGRPHRNKNQWLFTMNYALLNMQFTLINKQYALLTIHYALFN